VGDRIIYAKYTGSEIKIDNEKYLIMPESDILALKKSQTVARAATSSAGRKSRGK
jgi:hypothetical protein